MMDNWTVLQKLKLIGTVWLEVFCWLGHVFDPTKGFNYRPKFFNNGPGTYHWINGPIGENYVPPESQEVQSEPQVSANAPTDTLPIDFE